jgi:hypothetical protein
LVASRARSESHSFISAYLLCLRAPKQPASMVRVDVYGPGEQGPMSLFRAAAAKLPDAHNKQGQLVTDGFLDLCSLVVPVIGERGSQTCSSCLHVA